MMTTKLMAANSMPSSMEILAMARELLMDRYEEEKYRALEQWQALGEVTWNTTGTILPYPSLPDYPTCDEIIALARHLQAYFSEMQHDDITESEYVVRESWGKEEPEPEPVVEPEPFPAPVPTVESADAAIQQPTQPS
jgi:hypothetical protein